MEFRRARPEDLPAIVRLQNQNLEWNLDEKARADGFLSTAFSIEQFKEMDREIAVVVGYDGDKLCGYVCASHPAFNECMPFPAAMLKYAREQGVYRSKPLTAYDFCVTNPICIDKAYRGTRAYLHLCHAMLDLIEDRYDLAVSFVSTDNARHLHAMKILPWMVPGEFEKDGHRFVLIVLPLRVALQAA
jgi:hypothetical protein